MGRVRNPIWILGSRCVGVRCVSGLWRGASAYITIVTQSSGYAKHVLLCKSRPSGSSQDDRERACDFRHLSESFPGE